MSGGTGFPSARVPDLGDAPFGRSLREHWLLEPGMHFLNHGSYGATPRAVLEAQAEWRERMERQPVRFMNAELPGLLRAAAAQLAAFVGAKGEDIAFVENATAGVNTVLRSLPLRPGDEIVLSRHAYLGVRNAVLARCRETGAAVREAAVPFPLAGGQEVVASFEAALGPAARLAIVDHVSSPLAIVQPVSELVALCRGRGVPVLVDGAHAPGMLDLRVEEIGADWYVGNCHKWLLAPKGSAFLWAAPGARAALHPLVISNRWGEGFPFEFDWTGTRDPSAWLATPAAIAFLGALGLERYRAHIAALARDAARTLAQAWNVALPAPETMLAAMATLSLPPAVQRLGAKRVHDALWESWRIEVPVLDFDGSLWIRISGQAYNEPDDYRALGKAVLELLS